MYKYTQEEIDNDVPELDSIARAWFRERNAELAGDWVEDETPNDDWWDKDASEPEFPEWDYPE